MIKKKKISYSQFSTFFSCEFKYYRDYILKEKQFEDSLNMSFGTAIHETIQLYLKVLFKMPEKNAQKINLVKYFIWAFKYEVTKRKIPHTPEELNEFIEDGKLIIAEFICPSNQKRYFPTNKWELMAIEDEITMDIQNNLQITGLLDIVFREKATGKIKIVDFKTSTRGWSTAEKENFLKLAQLRLYKALYSRKYNIPLNDISVEFIILQRKTYSKGNYEQSRIIPFKPMAFKQDVVETIDEIKKFINHCFTENGEYITTTKYRKIPGEKKTNCKYCAYAKNGKCDQKADKLTET